ncbi:MAG: carboxypeptidase-like regulatory domain-containing protein [Planctomycetota bacterium]|nr:carboxypeptidase-like regulatory domain-containing protein [Planctomycetota bacterium]MDA1213917.1 carboxypeptidase-like regulatory domain-containing protein [Planctomycetota bacterium]
MYRKSIVLCMVLLFGCGPEGPPLLELEPVTGTVTLDGKPLNNAVVMFIPINEGLESNAKTNDQGVYELEIRGNKGIKAGEYKVTINKRVKPDGSELDPGGGMGENLLPAKYSEMVNTELKATVPKGGGKIDFDLKLK